MALRKIGEGVTDSNGRCIISYTGTGAGLLQLKGQCADGDSIIQSEIFSLWDCYKYDDESIPIADSIWTISNNSNTNFTRETGYSKITEVSGSYDAWITTQIPHKIALQFDLKLDGTLMSDDFCQFGQSAHAGTRANLKLPIGVRDKEWHTIKIELDSGVATLTATDGTEPFVANLTSYDPSMDMYFRFRTVSNITEIDFKNFRIYQI